jgi:hypothetical protein
MSRKPVTRSDWDIVTKKRSRAEKKRSEHWLETCEKWDVVDGSFASAWKT